MKLLGWIRSNFGALLVALALAITVWVSAVMNADPNQLCTNLTGAPLEIVGQGASLRRLGTLPDRIQMDLWAPSSICAAIGDDPQALQAVIDLSGLQEGQHTVSVQVMPVDYRPVRMLDYTPKSVTLTLEELASRSVPVEVVILGSPAPGYEVQSPTASEQAIVISGPRQKVEQVVRAAAVLDISDATRTIERTVTLQLQDANGRAVTGLVLVPDRVAVTEVIERPGNVRDVTVRPVTIGQQAEGYQLTFISVSPQVITLFSNDEQVLRDMPGFVETIPLDLTNATDDVERRLSVVLPEGVSVFGDEQTVVVQVGIAAIERSRPLFSLPVAVVGLGEGLAANLSISMVDVIVSGPGPLLDLLGVSDVQVFVDVTNLPVGLYSLEPKVEIAPVGVRKESVLPTTIEVTIGPIPTPTPTPTPGPTPTP